MDWMFEIEMCVGLLRAEASKAAPDGPTIDDVATRLDDVLEYLRKH